MMLSKCLTIRVLAALSSWGNVGSSPAAWKAAFMSSEKIFSHSDVDGKIKLKKLLPSVHLIILSRLLLQMLSRISFLLGDGEKTLNFTEIV